MAGMRVGDGSGWKLRKVSTATHGNSNVMHIAALASNASGATIRITEMASRFALRQTMFMNITGYRSLVWASQRIQEKDR
jgi:hypothetical protein